MNESPIIASLHVCLFQICLYTVALLTMQMKVLLLFHSTSVNFENSTKYPIIQIIFLCHKINGILQPVPRPVILDSTSPYNRLGTCTNVEPG